jgi:DNA-binding ferritin-like protein (Dps family)
VHEKLFISLKIGPMSQKERSKGRTPWSANKLLCLVLDLAEVPVQKGNMDSKSISDSINSYCCKIIEKFGDKYQRELGFD